MNDSNMAASALEKKAENEDYAAIAAHGARDI